MRRHFEGKVVWITGASSGIGAALAEALAWEGARLILSARRRAELEQVAARCDNEPFVLPLDLAEPETFPAHVATVLERFGHIDFIFHNGGVSQRALAQETHLDVDRRIMSINYFGAVALTKAVLPSMVKAKSGHLVVISSVLGKIGTPQRSAYAASKHALHGFFDCLRAEVTDDGLFVTLICPGYIQTDVSKNALTGDGSPKNTVDRDIAGGYPADLTALQILEAVGERRSEAYVGAFGKERLALFLKRFMPGVLEALARKAVPK